MDIIKELLNLKDEKYANFNSKLIPNVEKKKIIGVKVPNIRKLAKEFMKEDYKIFLDKLPHVYLEEDLLHGIIISETKDYDICIERLDTFLPYVNNWLVCDIIAPKVLKNNKEKVLNEIKRWINSKNVYECRFAIKLLMSYFLDADFKVEYLDLVASVKSDEYYINMMIAWYFATALAKKYDETIIYLEENKLNKWIHNKTIQKAIESYRVDSDKKEYLRTLKIK